MPASLSKSISSTFLIQCLVCSQSFWFWSPISHIFSYFALLYLTLCLPVLMFLGGACCSCRYVDKLKQEKSQLAQSSSRPGGTAENPIYVRAHIINPYNVYPRSRPSFKCKSGIGFVSKSKSIWVRRWRAGDVLGDKGKVVSQLLRQGQRLLHLMIVGSDTERAGAENGFLTWGKMWPLIEGQGGHWSRWYWLLVDNLFFA